MENVWTPFPARCRFLIIAVGLFTAHLQASPKILWQIGKFDHSPVEFQSSAKEVNYEVGRSDWRKDWTAAQPVGQPYHVAFDLAPLQGEYALRIGVLIEKPRVPTLRVEVNGHSGTFFLHPQLSYSRSDFTYAFDPHEAQSELLIALPNHFLRTGRNALTVTSIDDPVSNTEEQKMSGITFDALSLEQEFRQSAVSGIEAKVEPSIFYRSIGQVLLETVDVFIRCGTTAETGQAVLSIRGKEYKAKLTDLTGFGEKRVSFEVPEWIGGTEAKLTVTAGMRKVFDVVLRPERKWTVFVVPHTHLDIGFTDYQGKVAETQARVLTQAASLIERYPDFRFSMDGSWNLQQFLETRPKAKQDEILELIRSGKMAMPAQYVNVLTGYASLETLYRSLYQSKAYATQYGLPYEYANITDVPTYSGSYPSILAASGIKYWVAAANNDRAPIFNFKQWNEKSPFWWRGPDGNKVLFWYSRHYEQAQALFGLPPQLAAITQSLPIYLQAYSRPDYKPNVALIYGTQVENTDLFPSTATFATEWDKRYAYPKLTYSTFPDFFHFLDDHYSKDLPTYEGDGGGYWEDGIGSDAYYAVEDRRNQNRALSAEILSTVTHTLDANLNPPTALFADIWRNIVLFSEHTWLSYNSVSQPDHDQSIRQLRVKDDRAERASLEIEDVMNRSLSQLADQIHVPADTLIVFNPLNWKRDAIVETDLPEDAGLIDLTTNEPAQAQVVFRKQNFARFRFLAMDLPSVGYKCFRISSGIKRPALTEAVPSNTIENSFYRVTVDPASGTISGIFDKALQRELVDQGSPYKFAEYLYVTGGDGNTQMINPFPALPPGELTIHQPSNGKLVSVERVPWGQLIRLRSTNTNTPEITIELLLFDHEKKIEITCRFRKEYTNEKEAVYLAFPVAVTTPAFTYASQQGWIDPAHDLMKGGSLEWFNVQGWMAVNNSEVSVGIVPLDASLANFGDINRGKWPGSFAPISSTVFSYLMNNYWHTNYRAGQGGEFVFRYAVTSGTKLDGGSLARLSAEEMRPAELDYVAGQDKAGNPDRPLPPEGRSFFDTSVSSVVLDTWKEAENGRGTIMRLSEVSGRATRATVRLPYSTIRAAHITSGVEDNKSEVQVNGNSMELSFKPFEVITVRVE